MVVTEAVMPFAVLDLMTCVAEYAGAATWTLVTAPLWVVTDTVTPLLVADFVVEPRFSVGNA